MKKKIALSIVLLFLLGFGLIVFCNCIVADAAKNKLYYEAELTPHRKVGLLLGTSPISTWTGRRNYYFDHRITAAAELYKAGKLDWIVVSGGDYRNTENGYDEPVAMRDSLMKQGVDSIRIILDYDGTRTLNSIAKIRDIYRQDSIIIISQAFHNERALYQAKYLGIDAIGFNAVNPTEKSSVWLNRGREVLARVKLFIDILRGLQPDIKESMVCDFTNQETELLDISHIETPYGDLICLMPDMKYLDIDLVCGAIPNADNDSIVLAFAGAFTGEKLKEFRHTNIAGDHISGGKRYKGYHCLRNTGAFIWSRETGPQFGYQNCNEMLNLAEKYCGIGFTQEMMIHKGKKVETTRSLSNKNIFRALCLNAKGDLAIYESQGIVSFGNFIEALLSQNVKEALYTDMGQGWNYCFYRVNATEKSPTYLHNLPLPYASNFVILKKK